MNSKELNFAKVLYPMFVGDEVVDVVELADGRLLVIDGESVKLYDDFDQMLEVAEGISDAQHPPIWL